MTEVTDSQVLASLLTEEKVAGYTVKPWTIKQLLQVTPILKVLAEELKRMGVTVENFADVVADQGLTGIAGLLNLILPQLPEFLAVSLRVSREEAEDIDVGLALQLAVKVLGVNLEHLKNSFGLIMSQVAPVIRPEGTH
jgi:hypothetical protein